MTLPEFANTNVEPEIQNPYDGDKNTTLNILSNSWKNFSGKQRIVLSAILLMVFAVPATAALVINQSSFERSRASEPVTSPVPPTPTPIAGECIRQTPKFTVSPVNQKAAAGKEVIYKLYIQTNDSSPDCSPWKFNLSLTKPNSTWVAYPTLPNPIYAKPQDTVSLEYHLTSPTNTLLGKYNLVFELTDNNGYTITQPATYEVTKLNFPTPTATPKATIKPVTSPKPFSTLNPRVIPIPTTPGSSF